MTRAAPHLLARPLALAGLSLLLAGPALARTRLNEPTVAQALASWPDRARGPIILAVSLSDQRLAIWDNGTLVARTPVSTGVAGHETPRGAFTLLQKKRMHRSNIYSNAPMPYMQRITWSGVALHQGHVTGRPASHGCIRLPADIARKLFGYTRIGARVIVTDDPVAPADFAHPGLFSALPPDQAAPPAPESALEPARVQLASLPPAQELMASAPDMLAPPAAQPPAPSEAPKAETPARQPTGHVSVFISGKERKLFIRQGFEPVYESPVEIDGGVMLGAHLFTAMAVDPRGGAVRWSRVSLPVKGAATASAAEALDRIKIPEDARIEVGRRLSAGASLLISDQGLGRETGKTATDFILLTP